MEGELGNLMKDWCYVILCLSYCFFAGKAVPQGCLRLLALLPVVALFLLLPFNLSSMHFAGLTSFFISWLANFKLLLFAFGGGPLAADQEASLPHFIALASLPIKLRPLQKEPAAAAAQFLPRRALLLAGKACLLAVIVKANPLIRAAHPTLLLIFYSVQMYLSLEIMLLAVAAAARGLLRHDLEPQFDEPYLATSLQDFWSRRWNLMVTRIMRPTVYLPVLRAAAPFIGRKWAPVPAILTTFLVSGLMHELVFFHLGHLPPTWEITAFFLLQGACLTAEVMVKKACSDGDRRRWVAPRAVAGPITVVFVGGTSLWLFLPQLLRVRADVRACEEYAAVGAFVRDIGRRFTAPHPQNATAHIL